MPHLNTHELKEYFNSTNIIYVLICYVGSIPMFGLAVMRSCFRRLFFSAPSRLLFPVPSARRAPRGPGRAGRRTGPPTAKSTEPQRAAAELAQKIPCRCMATAPGLIALGAIPAVPRRPLPPPRPPPPLPSLLSLSA